MVDDDIFIYTGGEAPRDVRRVRICESIDTVPRRAFFDCRQLIEVEGHNKLKKIEEMAFICCISLRQITKMGGVVEIEHGAFLGCLALGDVEFDKLEIIGFQAFAYCKSLTSINLPSPRRILAYTFHKCEGLTEAVFGKDLEIIERYAFYSCTALRRIAIPLKNNLIVEDIAFNLCENLSRVDVIGGIQKTMSSLHMESWRDEIKEEMDRINQILPDTQSAAKGAAIQQWIESLHSKMEHYKTEHKILVKEAVPLLELALWKVNLDENDVDLEGVRVTRRQVKRARKDRCITSGAGIIIKNVLPFLQLS